MAAGSSSCQKSFSGSFANVTELPFSPPETTPTPERAGGSAAPRAAACRHVSGTHPRRTRIARLRSELNTGVTTIQPFSGTPMWLFTRGPTNLHKTPVSGAERSGFCGGQAVRRAVRRGDG